MNLYEMLFVIFFLLAIGILLLKVYNAVRLATAGPLYEFPGAVITFISYALMWAFTLVVMLHEPSETVYVTLWHFLSWCMLLNVMLFIIEVFLTMKFAATQPIKPFFSQPKSFTPYSPGKR